MINPKSQNQPHMGPVFLLRVVFSPALQPRFQLLSQSTRRQPLHGMLSFLPLHCLNQPLSDSSGRLQVYLCWGREAVSACPRSGRRGLGRWVLWEWARGHAVGYRWTAPGAVLCTPICSMCVQTRLCIMLICNYNKHFYLSFIFFFFLSVSGAIPGWVMGPPNVVEKYHPVRVPEQPVPVSYCCSLGWHAQK